MRAQIDLNTLLVLSVAAALIISVLAVFFYVIPHLTSSIEKLVEAGTKPIIIVYSNGKIQTSPG